MWLEKHHEITETESHQSAKILFLSSDGLVQNCLTIFAQNSSILHQAVHNPFTTLKSHKAL